MDLYIFKVVNVVLSLFNCNNKSCIRYCIFVLFSCVAVNSILCNKSYSASDINGSYEEKIKIFDNCKVSLVTLKNNKKFVFLEMLHTPIVIFRIIFNKNKVVGYCEVCPNYANIANGEKEKGYANVFIGDKHYNVERTSHVHGGYMISYLNMPTNFINLLSKNKGFHIEYSNLPGSTPPVSLQGFSKAMSYVRQLQSSL